VTSQIRPRINTAQLSALGAAAEIVIDAAPANDPRVYIWEAVDSRLRAEEVVDGKQIRPRMGLGEIEATVDICTIAMTHLDRRHDKNFPLWDKLARRMKKELVKAAAKIVEDAGATITNLDTSESCMSAS
jgi:hypothetical protein